jgi:hypothetical protein
MSRISIGKVAILLKTIYRFHTFPIKIPMNFLTEIESITLKFIWKQKTLNSQGILRKMSINNIIIPEFKLHCIAIIAKTTMYCTKACMKTNEMEDPEIIPHNCSHLILNKGTKNIHKEKDSIFTSGVWKTAYPHIEN